ncbi:MAG TPA: hypothetical protein VGF24_30460 [Vicinamibacterales bacterium]|jgi:hypothetical protein
MAKKPVVNFPSPSSAASPVGSSEPPGSSDPPQSESPAPKPDPLNDLFALDRAIATDEQIQELVQQYVTQLVQSRSALSPYNVLILHDGRSIDRSDSNRIYQALPGVDRSKPILLILRSPGGDVSAAYFIGKLCREYTSAEFEVAVPREAKSAATLICCGADTVHMGSLSELGPIDPQFGGMPALAVKHSLEHLAEIVTRHPGAKDMLSEYLVKALPVNVVGHFERAAGSAAQYAERLLGSRRASLGSSANAEIARRLVYDYKDHGFAIDAREALSIFGDGMIRTNSPQYDAANQVYDEIDFLEWLLNRRFDRDFSFTGDLASGCKVMLKRETQQSA